MSLTLCFRYCPYVALVGLVILLIAVVPGGSSRKEFIPWLTLLFTALSFFTVSLAPILYHLGVHQTDGGRTGRWFSASDFLHILGPRSNLSGPPSDEESAVNLSDVDPRMGPNWDSQTRGFFADETAHPQVDGARDTRPEPFHIAAFAPRAGASRDFEASSLEPLLGSQD